MKKLIITSHPSSKGFTHKIAEEFRKGSIEAGHKIELLDLYAPENHQDFLKFENNREMPENKNKTKIQEKISNADELIFIFPIWWGDSPAIMKNFIDVNLEAGYAFKYTKKGPVGLLNGKSAKIFMTCDGPGFIYKFFMLPLNTGRMWNLYRLRFCGIKPTKWTLFDGMRKRDEKNRSTLLKKVYENAKKD